MSAIQFDAMFPPVWVAAFAAVMLIVFTWLEVRRKQKLLPLRLVAVILAILCLACLVLNPSRTVGNSSGLILLTSRYDTHVLDSLLDKKSASQVYTLPDVKGPERASSIDYRALKNLKGNIIILGDGLPDYALEYIDTASLQFYPSKQYEGVATINAPKIYTVNQPGTVEGLYGGVAKHNLKLFAGGMAVDSTQVINGFPFTLSFTPKAPGRFVYTLFETDSAGKIISKQPFPIEVKNQKQLSILVLADYPSGETRFLKNYLEGQHHKLTLRYRISKDKYRTEFVNTEPTTSTRLTEAMLQNFDLVITDISSLQSLSTSERDALKRATGAGLGTLTILNDPAPPRTMLDFIDVQVAKIRTDSATAILNNLRLKVPATAVTISSDRPVISIIHGTDGRILAGFTQYGLGKTGFQLLTNTFSIHLSGQTETYAALWSAIVTTLSRKEHRLYDLTVSTPFPLYPDEPVEFQITAAAEKPRVTFNSTDVPLAEHPLSKNVWYGKVWAGEPGWNTLIINQDSSVHSFFVTKEGEWNTVRVTNQQRSLKKIVSAHNAAPNVELIQHFPRLLFFIVFLLAAGLLWLAPKL